VTEMPLRSDWQESFYSSAWLNRGWTLKSCSRQYQSISSCVEDSAYATTRHLFDYCTTSLASRSLRCATTPQASSAHQNEGGGLIIT
jgi:hypothetical protein